MADKQQAAAQYSLGRRIAAWSVHFFTGLGAVLGLFSLVEIVRGEIVTAFWLIAGTILIDALDGTFARLARVTVVTPHFDGAMLDNLIDYLNYVVMPAFMLMMSDLVVTGWRPVVASLIVLSSGYQFSQKDAKTSDHFFKGFPSYWNIVMFYMFVWQTKPSFNLVILSVLIVLVFVPIKYIYPSRMEHVTRSVWLQRAMLGATLLWGAATFGLLLLYPQRSTVLSTIAIGYITLYAVLSVYRTLVPLGK